MSVPVSIRSNNPGAMWGGARAAKWGATADIRLHDGQGNHIAVFPTKVQGAAAQFDLWRTSYSGMTLRAGIARWSGGNSSPAYVAFLTRRTGIRADDVITRELLAGPRGLALMQAQAHWEAGRPYPMTEAEWRRAQAMVFGRHEPQPEPPKPEPTRPERPPEPRPRRPQNEGPPPKKGLWHRFRAWLFHTRLGRLAGTAAGGGALGSLTTWQVVAVVFAALLVCFFVMVWLFGKDRVKSAVERAATKLGGLAS